MQLASWWVVKKDKLMVDERVATRAAERGERMADAKVEKLVVARVASRGVRMVAVKD